MLNNADAALKTINNTAPTALTLDTLPLTTLHEIVSYSFLEGHGFPPHEWQKDCISHVLKGSSTHSGATPHPFLICRSTGGGKSVCRNTLGFIQGGVTLTIVPLLSLGADQTAKLQSLTDAKQLPVELHHLDEYRGRDDNRSLHRKLDTLTNDSVTLFLFSSPQKLLSSEWSDCVASLIKRTSVPFTLCVDECHLYAQFGAEFRAKFHAMKACLFPPILKYRPSTPILFLTPTASQTVLIDLEELTGLCFDQTGLLWSGNASSVARRQVLLNIQPTESPLAPLKADIRRRYGRQSARGNPGVGPVPKEKLIFYSNLRKL
jgi:superfamily II DNA helicase RecQ